MYNLTVEEETVKFISEKLPVQAVNAMVIGHLATQLLERLKDRYSNRGSEDIVSLSIFLLLRTLTLYLHSVVTDYQFRIPTKTTLISKAKRIHDRLLVDK